MRAKIRLIAAAPMLCLALLAEVRAQAQNGTPQPNAAPRTAAPQTPSAANPNPDTPTPQAPDMQTYIGMLQKVSQDLRQEITRVEGGARPTQRGAVSPDVIHLMQTTREAWRTAERAPASFTGNPVYTETMQDMRHRFSSFLHEHPAAPPPQSLEAARGVLQSLEKLHQAATSSPS
ncbi:hypothetical protein [Roseomonas chloroacetimidivorans]|jgi:hypothetical protein|uniref:hypothetical protein n=1 Tax=Roseomonas chloroacetimidivorans TaxID=1766656 RepID=UPI003C71C070